MRLYSEVPREAGTNIRERQAAYESLLSAMRSSPPLEGN